jgi:DNA-binding beta-propeller fold protein YncE
MGMARLTLVGVASLAAVTRPLVAQAPAAAATPYRVIQTFDVCDDGGWDCLTIDPGSKRLFVPRGTHVMVLNTDNGEKVGDITETAGVHDVALAIELNKGFTSNGRSASVTVFDLKTLKTLGTVKAGDNPDAIIYEPSTKRVLAFNGRSKDATVINAEDLTVAGTIPIGGKPELAAVDGAGKVFVNVEDTSEVLRIDAKAMKVEQRWPLAPGEGPTGLAIDPVHHRLFSACGNQKMVILDSQSGKILGSPPIGKGVDGAEFDAAGFALASNGEGTLTVVETTDDKFDVAQTLSTAPRARTLAFDPKTRRIYLPTAEFEAPKEGATGRPPMKPGTFRIVVVGP